MKTIKEYKTDHFKQEFVVPVSYSVYFTEDLLNGTNETLAKVVASSSSQKPVKTLFVLDSGLVEKNESLPQQITSYCNGRKEIFAPASEILILPGGEESKNDRKHAEAVVDKINDNKICRHSFVIAIGGGAILDTVGYAAAISHRGVRLVRVPTTVLAQNDSGIGVKNGINYFNKKNFIGTFSPPFAVINDINFLNTLDDRDWRSGIAEAIKVALIKDKEFFLFLEESIEQLVKRDQEAMAYLIRRCAELHLEHISSGDPFETGSSRPLDFGHWAAHKLENLTAYSLRHGEAVAIGIALDSTYSFFKDLLPESELNRVLNMISNFGFKVFIPELLEANGKKYAVLEGTEEFREHLGGQLTIMLLEKIGKGLEVHEIDTGLMEKSIKMLQQYEEKNQL